MEININPDQGSCSLFCLEKSIRQFTGDDWEMIEKQGQLKYFIFVLGFAVDCQQKPDKLKGYRFPDNLLASGQVIKRLVL